MDTIQPEHGYRAFGLTIRSDLVLPELMADAAEPADVTIRMHPPGQDPSDASECSGHVFGRDTQCLDWPGVGTFHIRGTSAIDIAPARDVSEPLLNFPLLGPVIALLLHLRGLFVLHASGVEIAGRGAMFLGAKGAGKSTIGAALVAAGHRLLSDDVLAVDFSDAAGPQIVPGFPQFKLVEDAASKVALAESVSMPSPIPNFPKQQRRLTTNFSHAYAPPERIYVMARGPAPAIVPISAHDALKSLMCFSYVSLFRRRPLSSEEAGVHLRQCTALANSVCVSRLEMPNDLDRIGEAVRLVECDQS